MEQSIKSATAFAGSRRIASGDLAQVALAVKAAVDREASVPVLVFDDETSRLVELDLRGTPQEVVGRLSAAPNPSTPAAGAEPRGPGRPKLGVIAREITLLPRHWQWLGAQPGGASVALRKLVDEARRVNDGRDRIRRAREITYRFMSAMAGDYAGYEEAIRGLFAGNRPRFRDSIGSWPADVRTHIDALSTSAWDD
jgi:hypothetical protein